MYHLDTPVLTTERLTLRAPQGGDWPAFATFVTSPRAEYIGGPLTRERAWRALGHAVGHWLLRGYGLFILTPTGTDQAIGMAGPWFPAGWPEREIGWSMFGVQTEGKGLVAEAARAVRRHVYTTLNWPTAVSYFAVANARFIALATRLGATLDRTATAPDRDGTLVFRHPRLGAC